MPEKEHPHIVPLWGLFVALLALTAAEVGLYEFWQRSGEQVNGQMVYFIPKFAIVLLILVFTLPKALVVLIFFMHLKFEKQMIVTLAIVPFIVAGIAVLLTLSDTKALHDQAQASRSVAGLKDYSLHRHKRGSGGQVSGDGDHANVEEDTDSGAGF